MKVPGPKGPKDKVSHPKAVQASKKKIQPVTDSTKVAPTAKAPIKPKPTRILPVLHWKQVPTRLDQRDADDRIFIREFIYRFGEYLQPTVGKTHLEELEFISGRSNDRAGNNDFPGWVSELAVRSMAIGLLGFFAKYREDETTQVKSYMLFHS